jgi:hypothetical protein
MGILDYLILAGIAVGILAAVRHLKRNSVEIVATVRRKNRKIFGEIFFSEDFYGISARGKEGYFSFLCALLFFTEKQAEKICNFSQINIFSQ